MAWWKGEFMELGSSATTDIMDTFILDANLFVDDDNLAYEFLPPGTRWDEEQKKMVVDPSKVEEDLEAEEDERTMVQIQRMADSICPAIQTTYDCPSKHDSGKMPLLDTQQWVEWVHQEGGGGEWEVRWQFYRKPCAPRTLMLARSAMPDRVKRSTLTQEALRVLRNTSPRLPWDMKAEMLTDFSLRMKLSGYTENYRQTIINSALVAWQRIEEKDRTGERPLYRSREWKRDERIEQKEKKRGGWYRGLRGQTNDFPLFCPMSPGGKLAARWKKVVEEVRVGSGGLVRGYVTEQCGVPLGALLYDNQPGESDFCGTDDCNPCARGTTKKKNCRRMAKGGLVYSCRCLTCEEEVRGGGGEEEEVRRGGEEEEEEIKKKSRYHGESHKTLYSRQKKHNTDLDTRKDFNAMFKHQTNHHNGGQPKLEKCFKDPMERIIYEGVSINNSPSSHGLLKNSKAEYKQGEVARVVMVRGLGE